MPGKRYNLQEIVAKLRQVDANIPMQIDESFAIETVVCAENLIRRHVPFSQFKFPVP